MKSDTNTSKKIKLNEQQDKNKIRNQKLSPQKKVKEPPKNINSKSVKKFIKPQLSINKSRLTKEKEKVYNLKEQYSLYKRELQSLRDEEEKIKALEDKLKLQKNIYNNIVNNYTNINLKEKKFHQILKCSKRIY